MSDNHKTKGELIEERNQALTKLEKIESILNETKEVDATQAVGVLSRHNRDNIMALNKIREVMEDE